MKVRWTNDGLRLRITPRELAALERGDVVCEALWFAGGGGWTIALDPDGPSAGATWSAGIVRVELTPTHVRRLAAPDAEGVYAHTADMRLVVEKDFPCAHPHAPEAHEAETERFAPTAAYLERKAGSVRACAALRAGG